MHETALEQWHLEHNFNSDKQHLERKTLIVVVITMVMMVAEILVGWLSNSMALLADGWHMGTHAFALGISLIAYAVARKQAHNRQFAFGTWKIEILGAYTSALFLGAAGIGMVYSSVERLIHPLPIHYNEALWVAAIGLLVNFICAFILRDSSHKHHHGHTHSHHHHDHGDLNHKSAYLHVVADALTSVFAIAALFGAKYFSLAWLDPCMGIVGAALIARWALFLLRDSAAILLDHQRSSPLSIKVTQCIEGDSESRVSDIHTWKVADAKYAAIIAVTSPAKHSAREFKERLAHIQELVHVTVEVN